MLRYLLVTMIFLNGCLHLRKSARASRSQPSTNTATKNAIDTKDPLNAGAPRGGFLTAASCSFVTQVATCVEVRSRDASVISKHKSDCVNKRIELSARKTKFSGDVCKSAATHLCTASQMKAGKRWTELRYYDAISKKQIGDLTRDCEERNGKLVALGMGANR